MLSFAALADLLADAHEVIRRLVTAMNHWLSVCTE